MTGGLLELVAHGEQDKYLIGSPQMSFFKTIYKRHTNFSIESKKVYFKEKLLYGSTLNCTIPKNGDLINNIILQLELENIDDPNISYVNNVGYSIIDVIDIYIGNTLIDSHTGDWLNIWSELTTPEGKKQGLNNMLGKYPFEFHNKFYLNKGGKYIIPLSFWFTQNNGLSIPLVALQYHDVRIVLKLSAFNKMWKSKNDTIPSREYKIIDCNLLVDYIYVDNDERKFFAQNNHQYLIKQIQINKHNVSYKNNTKKKINLNFKHPISELIWFLRRQDINDTTKEWFNYSADTICPYTDPLITGQILLNGVDRTLELDNQYLRLYQPYKRHTNIPNSFIYLYSFALNPEEYQPSGACNMSRLDNSQLVLDIKPNLPAMDIVIFAVNYNILKIQAGMGGLGYIN